MIEHLRSRHYEPERYLTQWINTDCLTIPLFDFAGAAPRHAGVYARLP